MKIHAYKYQGAGNDFVIIDNRDGEYDNISPKIVNRLCDRRFGIGGDGLMLLGKSERYDFSMRYFNSDGPEGTMCGNGGRCLVAFASKMGLEKFEFEAIDGYHKADVLQKGEHANIVRLKMIDIDDFGPFTPSTTVGRFELLKAASLECDAATLECDAAPDCFFINTGSPHYVEYVKNVADYPVDALGKYWRWHKDFEKGTNVNFVEVIPTSPNSAIKALQQYGILGAEENLCGSLKVRTYERGVEAETFACGTGVTASALTAFRRRMLQLAMSETPDAATSASAVHSASAATSASAVHSASAANSARPCATVPAECAHGHKYIYAVNALGGELAVEFEYEKEAGNGSGKFRNIYLTGPATFVFETYIEIF